MHHVVTFNFGSAKVFSPSIFGISFSYDKDIYGLLFFVLFPLTSVLQLINFTAS